MRFPATTLATRLVLLLAVSTAAIVPATAQHEPNCNNPMSQMELNICSGRAFAQADKDLNAIYGRVRATMRDRDRDLPPELCGAPKSLLSGQRGWIAYRDGHCETVGSEAAGGTMRPMLESACMSELTRARTNELRSLIAER